MWSRSCWTGNSGQKIETASDWEKKRRDEVVKLFEEQMYGRVPEFDYNTNYQIKRLKSQLSKGVVQEEIIITLTNSSGEIPIKMLLSLPAEPANKIPIFLGLNFKGNQATSLNPEIPITTNYVTASDRPGIVNNRATEESRGGWASRWPVDLIVGRGYGLATIHCGDIDPDFDDGFENGVHSLLATRPQPDQWGTVAAWAWGLSRALDYLQTDSRIDGNKIAVIGHSRLGKAALWAGATDQRFAMVISNNSGCGGAALSRRQFGETVEAINTRFPHWFCENFHQYNGHEDKLPIDQHMLLALMAPRPVYVASALEDQWADPIGEYTSLVMAGMVYQLFGHPVLPEDVAPEVDKPLANGKQGYHLRSGRHDITSYDWKQYLDFADKQFNGN